MHTPWLSIGATAATAAIATLVLALTASPSTAQEGTGPEYAAISGTASFVGSSPAESIEDAQTVPAIRAKGYRSDVLLQTDDSRLDGSLHATSNYIQLAPGPDGGLVRSGRARLSNDGGSWLAEFHGFAQPGTSVYSGSHYAIRLTGEDGYAGLSAMLLFLPTGPGEWDLNGILFPGPMPEYPPSLPPAE